ncbi:hypothetical protein KIPB_003777 [Kipferlia bialata]|uniref:25S rRNA (uridine-N(3))-methyltransferase BMT5-like domain-containing protein n=1 Tax=Kipferlia bialata TaxID=797122 RepID=A0A9K3CU96_9EUKA|nr:hypothetical protein KIPB_003777 [Kipferlia bialata]|eukprot:g3777.t1
MSDPAGAVSLLNLGLDVASDCVSALGDAGMSGERERVPRVLVLGDGDFSFSVSMLSTLSLSKGEGMSTGMAVSLTATCYDSEEVLLASYPEAASNIARLAAKGVPVCYGVDATDIVNTLPEDIISSGFDRVVFNFPQFPPRPKARNKIQLHRSLLRGTFAAAVASIDRTENGGRAVLAEGGEVWMTLARGQGGTAGDSEIRRYEDTWQIQDMAGQSGLVLKALYPFPLEPFRALGYHPCGYQNTGQRFLSGDSMTHVFVRESYTPYSADTVGVASADTPCLHPLLFQRDVSLVIEREGARGTSTPFNNDAFRADLTLYLQRQMVELTSCTVFDDFVHPKTKCHHRGFRLSFHSPVRAMSRERANAITEAIRKHFSR